VKINTFNVDVYGELGRYPLYVNRFVNIIEYWFTILNNKAITIQIVYIQAVNDCNKNIKIGSRMSKTCYIIVNLVIKISYIYSFSS